MHQFLLKQWEAYLKDLKTNMKTTYIGTDIDRFSKKVESLQKLD